MRGRMSDAKSYAAPVEIGAVVVGAALFRGSSTRAMQPSRRRYRPVAYGWQSYAIAKGDQVRKLDPAQAPVSTALGVIWACRALQPGRAGKYRASEPGETVVVAAASGAVGSVVGQIARIRGARAVGIAGGAQKCAFVLNELGFDAVIDHRSPNFAEELARHAPTELMSISKMSAARCGMQSSRCSIPLPAFPVCGLIAQYNAVPGETAGPDRLEGTMRAILTKSLSVRGFIQREFASQREQFHAVASAWIAQGQLRYREDIVDGLENAPEAFIGLLEGRNFGKLVIRVADEKA